MHATKQSGFGVVAIIVALLVVVGLGYIGYRVYTANNNQTGNATQSSNAQNNSTQAQADTYLDIKELGVKIKLSDEIKDAVYSYVASVNRPDVTPSGGVKLSSRALISMDTACSTDAAPLGTILKISSDTNNFGEKLVANGTTLLKLGNTFYTYVGPQTTCSNDSSVNSLASEQIAAFREAFKTIRLDK